MQFHIAALFSVLVACGFAQIATDGPTPTVPGVTCNLPLARSCLKTYIDHFGFNSTTTGVFPDPTTFSLAQNAFLTTHGVNGLTRAHTYYLALQSCLGPDFFPCLFDPDSLQQIFNTDSTSMDGTLWMIIFFEEDYANTQPAYGVIREYYHCAIQVQTHYNDSIQRCQTTYSNDVNKDPANVCSYQVFFMTCLQTIYGSNCGSKLGGYVCNEAGIYLRIMNQQCIDSPPSDNFCYSLT